MKIPEHLCNPLFTGLYLFGSSSEATAAARMFQQEHGGELRSGAFSMLKLPSGGRLVFDGPGVVHRHCGLQYHFIECAHDVPVVDQRYIKSRLRGGEGIPLDFHVL